MREEVEDGADGREVIEIELVGRSENIFSVLVTEKTTRVFCGGGEGTAAPGEAVQRSDRIRNSSQVGRGVAGERQICRERAAGLTDRRQGHRGSRQTLRRGRRQQ